MPAIVNGRKRPVLVFPAAHHRGGVERIVWQAAHHLSAFGPVVFVGDSFEPAVPGVSHVRVEQRGGGAIGPWRFRRAATRAIAATRGEADVVVSFGADCPPGDVLVVNSVHQSWLRQGAAVHVKGLSVPNVVRRLLLRHMVLLRLERSYFSDVGRRSVVVVSSRVADDLEQLYGIPLERTVVLHNGYSVEQCSPERRARHRASQRAAWKIGPDRIALLFVGNELHRKGFECLLAAVARSAEPSFEIHVVGRAPIDPYAGRITELGLDGRVHYHGPVDIGLAHAAADALVLPTQYEAFALTIVEALASGLPVVTTTVPGAGDLIQHDRNGLLQHDPNDPAELAALLGAIADPSVRKRLGAAAPAGVAELEWSRLMARLDQIIQAA